MRVRIQDLFHRGVYGIWFIEDRIINGVRKRYVAKPVQLEFVEMPNQWQLPDPTMEIDAEYSQDFMRALNEGLAQAGFSMSNTKIEGLLEAQSKHLEDMRKLVFK